MAPYQVELAMSAWSQKQTYAPQKGMSALPPKATSSAYMECPPDVNLRNHLPGIGIISITSTVAFGMVKCGLSAKRAAAASCDSACTIE